MTLHNRFAYATVVAAAVLALGLHPTVVNAATGANPYTWNQPGCPCATVLREGTPAEAGLMPQALDQINGSVHAAMANRTFPGAVVLVARRGVIAFWKAYGYAYLYKNADYTRAAHPRRMRKNEIFDLASVTKMFTTVAVMQLWDEGKFKLDDPVAKYLPKFGLNGKENVTIRELLTHTSGFRPDPPIPLYDIKGTREQRIDNVLEQPLEHPPGTHYVYSDMNFITLGALIEKLSGEREDVFIRKHLTGPLGLAGTMFNPPASLKPRIAATEYQPWTHRGLLWGQVDDENAWALGGVAGHAGLFSDVHDLAVFGQMMLNGGTYDGHRVLSQRAVKLILSHYNKKFPNDAMGLGWSLDQHWYQGALASLHTFGHEGFSGTSLLIDTKNDLVSVILTNRLQPNRNGPSDIVPLQAVNTDIANAIPVSPPGGGPAWFAGYGKYLNRTLTAKVNPQQDATLSFQTWYRMHDHDDFGSVEASRDGIHWHTLELLTGASGPWQTKRVKLPSDTRYIQFRYMTDNSINNRGWYVEEIRVTAAGKSSQPVITRNGWQRRDY